MEGPEDGVNADPWGAYDGNVARHPSASLAVHAGAWTEADIPPRPWIVPGYFMRGTLTVISGHGSAGKSLLSCAWAISAATAQPIGRFRPREPVRVGLFNVEDDDAEQQRRLSAALRQFGMTPADVAGRIIRMHPTPIGTLLDHDGLSGVTSATKILNLLEEAIKTYSLDLVFLDPLVELHTANENDNTAIRHVLARMRELAAKHNLAAGIVHHQRKGGTAGDPDAIRGASAIVGAARQVLTVATMTEDEAVALDQPPEHRFRFLRVDGAKLNYCLPSDAEWYEKAEHELDNGELIAAATPWAPPRFTADPAMIAAGLTALRRGLGGEPCSESNASDASVRRAFEAAGIPRAVHTQIMDDLKVSGDALIRGWRDPVARRIRKRVWVHGNTFEGWESAP